MTQLFHTYMGWVQTVLATKPVDKSKIDPVWECIFDSANCPGFGKKPLVQLWICHNDLKDEFYDCAREQFGDAVQQVVRLGDGPEVQFSI